MSFIVRKGLPQDVEAAFALITELAIYEKAPEQVTNTPADMLRDGFGANPAFGLLVAEVEGEVVGMSIYFIRYSTWKGRCLFLEDIVVTEKHRGKGIGKALFQQTVDEANRLDVNLMFWQVLDWNTPAIDFYKSMNAEIDPQWHNCKLYKNQLRAFPTK
jgi:GNAT superfamily N-acetyltransferase